MYSGDYLKYRRRLRAYATEELGFNDHYEYALFKYSHHLPLSYKEYEQIMEGEIPCDSHKTWEKYVNKKFKKRKKDGYRQNLIAYAKAKREEYKVFEDFYSGVFLVILATLLVQLGREVLNPINGFDWSMYPTMVRVIVSTGYAFICSILLVVFMIIISFWFTRDMKRRKFWKYFYSSLIDEMEG